MKKAVVLIAFVSLLFFTQCNQRGDEKLTGVWQLEQMNINGTEMDGQSLGVWLWEFNREGGFLSNVAGNTEKGWYKLANNKLTVQITSEENRAEQVYSVSKLDSASFEIITTEGKNNGTLRFVRREAYSGVEEE